MLKIQIYLVFVTFFELLAGRRVFEESKEKKNKRKRRRAKYSGIEF
jgi:hypothetical protein